MIPRTLWLSRQAGRGRLNERRPGALPGDERTTALIVPPIFHKRISTCHRAGEVIPPTLFLWIIPPLFLPGSGFQSDQSASQFPSPVSFLGIVKRRE